MNKIEVILCREITFDADLYVYGNDGEIVITKTVNGRHASRDERDESGLSTATLDVYPQDLGPLNARRVGDRGSGVGMTPPPRAP
jgi:hypothetical protein